MPLRAGKNIIIRGREGRIVKLIEEALQNPPATFLELMKEVGESGGKMIHLCREYNILLPEEMELGWRPEIDAEIRAGGTLEEIADRASRVSGGKKLSREGIRQYARNSGQKILREKRRAERKEKEQELRQHFLSLLEQKIEQMAKEQGWACQKALEHLKTHRCSIKYGFSEIWKLLQARQEAKEKGGKHSLNDLGKEIGICGNYVSKLFQKLDVEPVYGRRHPGTRRETREKKKRVCWGLETNLSVMDLVYFTQLSTYPVRRIFSEAGIPYSEKRPIEQFPTYRERGYRERCHLTYRLASQIYEEMDKGDLTEAEIAFCLDIPAIMMLYTLENRKEGKNIEREIVQALRKMYPEEKITKPYR